MADAAASATRPGAGLRTLVWLAFALLVVIMLASAVIRLAHGDAALDAAIDVARGVHRVAAAVAFAVILVVAILGWDDLRPAGRAQAAIAVQIALAVALALLGYYTPSENLLVRLGNPVGGLAMVGIGWWLALATSGEAFERCASSRAGAALIAAAFAGVAAIVIWPPPLVAGLAAQLAATVALAAGVTLLPRRSRRWPS